MYGGAEEDRTPDLRIANATLSQLSYGPVTESGQHSNTPIRAHSICVMNQLVRAWPRLEDSSWG